VLLDGRLQAADAGAKDDADLVAVFLVEFQAGIQQCLISGVNAELRIPVRTTDFLGRRKCGREVKLLHLAGDLGVERRRVKGGDPVNAALAGNQVVPENVQLMPERRDNAEAGDDHTTVCCIGCHKIKKGSWGGPSQTAPKRGKSQLFLV